MMMKLISVRSEARRVARELVAVMLVPALALGTVPLAAAPAGTATPAASMARPAPPQPAPAPPPAVQVNRVVPEVEPVPAYPRLSRRPTTDELTRARVFGEPLVPLGGEPSGEENEALAQALQAFQRRGVMDETGPLEALLDARGAGPWRASLLLNLGLVYLRTGRFTRAERVLAEAWDLGRNDRDDPGRTVADQAVGELLWVHSLFGRLEKMNALLDEIARREVRGSAAERVHNARLEAWGLTNRHHEAVPSGTAALSQLLRYTQAGRWDDPRLLAFHATPDGASLKEMRDLGREVGLRMRMAYREPGAPLMFPAMMHLRGEHFSAFIETGRGRFKLADPILGGELWLSSQALEEEASGYFLVPEAQRLPPGWREVDEKEADAVRGRCLWPIPQCTGGACCGNSGGNGGGGNSGGGRGGGGRSSSGGGSGRMATYTFQTLVAGLLVRDSPVGYQPPFGPGVEFTVTYEQRAPFQPGTFSFSNLGRRWSHAFMGWIEDNPSDTWAMAYAYRPGGGREDYQGFDGQAYAAERTTRAVLRRVSSSPIVYEREAADGSKEVYAQADGAVTSPRRVFLTQVVDPQGNALSLTYDSQLRLIAIADPIGQVTSLLYEAEDALKITRVTDPFGRSARFEYDASGYLAKITDVIGIASEFEYGAQDFIRALTTPYGTTLFRSGFETLSNLPSQHPNMARWWLEATDPLGGTERIEYSDMPTPIPASDPAASVPTGFASLNNGLNTRNSFYWDKRAMMLAPGDYNKAYITHWLWQGAYILAHPVVSNTKHSEKAALEGRLWYDYIEEGATQTESTFDLPVKIARVLDDGASQVYRYEYESQTGNISRLTDPLGRTTTYTYAANGIDLLEVRQINGQSTDLLQSFTYNSQHLPLTATDVAGQTTIYAYNTQGQLLTVTTPPRAGITENRTTTYAYDTNGYLQSVTGPAPGATTSYTYDGYGRARTVTDSDGYVVTTDYDALDRPTRDTYPDGTYEETVYNRLDAEGRRDRLGRWTQVFHDALRRVVAARDPMGRAYTLQWCNCGSLEKLVDPNGNATTWERDLQGRVTRQIRADGSDTVLTYESTTSRLKEAKDAKQQIAGIEYFLDNDWKRITYTNAQQPTPTLNFTYDPVYNRLMTLTDGTGTTTYTYNPVTSTPALGASHLASVDGPLSNDLIAYSYDELGRFTSQTIGGVGLSQTYDVLGRTGTETNPLGTFGYNYVGTTGRLDSVSYPNGQSTTFGYLGNLQDHRLQEIHNKLSGGATLSRFQYGYDAQGTIKTWTRQADSSPANAYEFQYDPSNRLSDATLKTTDPTPTILKRYRYSYDKNENRTGEQIDDTSLAATLNNLDQLVSHQPGGALRFAGTLNEAATVSVQGQPAQVTVDNRFDASAQVGQGTSNVAVTATDPSGNARTNTYQVNVSGSGKTFTHDANGNLTGDGTRTFEWEANNRLIAVVQGTHRSEFTYDGWGHRVRIVEKDNSVVTSDRRFLWCGMRICQERDGSGATVVRRFYGQGMQEGGVPFFYTRDHLESVREMTDSAGSIRARYDYDPYGRVTKVTGDKDSVYTFTDHLSHSPSGLALAPLRAYDPELGRWLSPDPIGLAAGPNLYGYVGAQPINFRDPLGLQSTDPTGQAGPGGIPPWLVPVTQAAEAAATKAAEAAGVAAGTMVAGCLVILAALCQTGDGHPPEDPQVVPPTTPPGPVPPTTPTTPPGPTPPPPSKRKQRDPVRYEPTNPGCDSSGKCRPCPPNQAWQAPGNAHGSTTGTHWHWITWNQDPKSCMCFPNRGSGPNKPPWAD